MSIIIDLPILVTTLVFVLCRLRLFFRCTFVIPRDRYSQLQFHVQCQNEISCCNLDSWWVTQISRKTLKLFRKTDESIDTSIKTPLTPSRWEACLFKVLFFKAFSFRRCRADSPLTCQSAVNDDWLWRPLTTSHMNFGVRIGYFLFSP